MNAAHVDFSAFEAKVRDLPHVPMIEELRVRRRSQSILLVASLAAIVLGVILRSLHISEDLGWTRLIAILIWGGAASVVLCAVRLRQTSSAVAARIAGFAKDNGFDFVPVRESAGFQGSNFTIGRDYRRRMVVNATFEGHPVEFGNLSFLNPNGRGPVIRPGYIAIRLPERLPHTMILSTGPLRQRLAFQPHADDRVDVGAGDAFRVHSPAGAGPIIRPFFTPETIDLIARLTQRFDIEIVGDSMLLISRRPVVTGSARKWSQILPQIAGLCGALDSLPVWDRMRAQPNHFLAHLPDLISGFDEARVKTIVWLCFGGFTVILTVIVAALHDW